MGELARDLVFSVRGLAKRPGLAAGVIATLGLGVGATTSIYSVVDGVLLRPLPYEDAGRLVAVGTTFPGREWEDGAGDLQHLAGSSLLNYLEFRDRARSFASLAAAQSTSVLLPDQGDGPELLPAAMVTPEFWSVLGVSPAVGRIFAPDEYSVDVEATPVLLSHGAWERRFGADPSVVGRSLARVGTSALVVGVLPADFSAPETLFGTPPEVYLPLPPDHRRYADRGNRSVVMVGRLAAGTGVDMARVELRAIADRLAVEFPDGNVYPDGSHFGAGVNGLLEETVGTTGRVLLVFLGAASLLFLIAVLNATTLLLARSLDRVRELGVRVALGASSGRIVRLLLAESLALAGLGGIAGAVLGYAGVAAFHRYGPASVPRMADIVVDGRVLGFTLVLTLATGLVAGLVPAFGHLRRAPWRDLAGRSGSEQGGRLRSALVAGQVAVAVLLLSAAGVLLRSFLELRAVDPGFEPEGRVAVRVPVKRPGAPEGEEIWQAWDLLVAEIASTPGVAAVAATSNTPFEDPSWAPRILLPGESDDTWREGVAGYAVTPGYFELIGTRLLRGRDFARADGPGAPAVGVVNQAFVSEVVAGADVLGMRIRAGEDHGEIEIVGVVANAIQARAEDGPRPALYVPYRQVDWPVLEAVARTDLTPETIVPELRRSAARFTGGIPAMRVSALEEQVARTRSDPRFQALLFGTFALVALLLAAAGLYATLSHAVGRRRRELGIRIALGARRRRVRAMVMLQGGRVAGLGLVAGLAGAMALNRVLAGLLFEVRPGDPLALGATALALALVALVAAYVPARMATSVDPVDVLKAE